MRWAAYSVAEMASDFPPLATQPELDALPIIQTTRKRLTPPFPLTSRAVYVEPTSKGNWQATCKPPPPLRHPLTGIAGTPWEAIDDLTGNAGETNRTPNGIDATCSTCGALNPLVAISKRGTTTLDWRCDNHDPGSNSVL